MIGDTITTQNGIKVLYLTEDESVLKEDSGARRMLLEFAQGVEELHVVVLNHHRVFAKVINPNPRLWIYPTNAYFSLFHILKSFQIALTQLMWKFNLRPNLIVADTPSLPGFIAVLLGKRFKRKTLVQVTTDTFSFEYKKRGIGQRVRRVLSLYVLRSATKVCVPNEKIKQTLEDARVHPLRISLVPRHMEIADLLNNKDAKNFTKEYPQFNFVTLMIVRNPATDHIRNALKALKRIIRVYPRVGVVILSSKSNAFFVKMRAKLMGISDHVVYERIPAHRGPYYRGAHLFLNASADEASDTYLVEALASSCAVVSTNIGVGPAFFANSPYEAYLCSIGDTDCVESRIRHLMERTGARDDMRVNVRYIVERSVQLSRPAYISKMLGEWKNTLKTNETS